MKFGVALPHFGPAASPDAIVEVAGAAESMGFDSLWALDRLLWPLEPTSKYPGNREGRIPEAMRNTYDPFTVLSFAASRTEKILLGTSVVVASYRSPLVVAKMAATLDVLSRGRFILGIGAGWSADEFSSSNQQIADRDDLTDEFLKVVRLLWTAEEPRFDGRFYRIPKSIFLPKPLQQPGPVIWIGGNSRRAVTRAAQFGDAWHPTNRIGPARLAAQMGELRTLAQEAGRDPEAIAATVRWNASALAQSFAAGEVLERLRQYQEAGVKHVCFDFNIPQPSSLSRMLATMERLMKEVIQRL
jgi:probable F420-dependent oxidoreductase